MLTAQTALVPLRALGLEQFWQHRREEILAAGPEGYREWLVKVEAKS